MNKTTQAIKAPVLRPRKLLANGDRARARVFAFICEYKASHDGNSPEIREIMIGTGTASSSTVYWHLQSLVELGWIKWTLKQSRSFEVTGGRWLPPETYEG
jgi:SOS-response transcriptional repressor LexA